MPPAPGAAAPPSPVFALADWHVVLPFCLLRILLLQARRHPLPHLALFHSL
jgi:hypothetical protein